MRPAPGRLEIALTVPPGSRWLRGRRLERQFLDALGSWPEFLVLRDHARRNVLEVAKWLARYASWDEGTTRPTRARICERAGICESTWKAVRRRLEAWGFLGTVREGTTDRFRRPWVLYDPEAPGEAAVYVLAIPRCVRPRGQRPPALAAPASPETRPPTGTGSTPRSVEARLWRIGPRSRADSLAALAEQLRTGAGKTISKRRGARLAAPFARWGWQPADIAWAIDHSPDGRQHRFDLYAGQSAVRNPSGWARWRLALWLEPPAGDVPWSQRRPMPPASLQRAVARQQDHAARAAAQVPPAPEPVDVAPRIRAIREQLGMHRGQGKQLIRWIEYPDQAARAARTGGRPRQGRLWQPGPSPGTVWAVPEDRADLLFVQVWRFPNAPEDNYALADPPQEGDA